MRVAIMALVTSIGTLVWTPVATGTQSAQTDHPLVAGAGARTQSAVNDIAGPATLEDAAGANEDTGENAGAGSSAEGPCGISEEGQASSATPGSSLKPAPAPTPIVFASQWEPYGGGLADSSCTPSPAATETRATPTTAVAGSKPPARIGAVSSPLSEGAAATDIAQTGAGAGNVAVAWGNNYAAGQLGAGYKDDYEAAPVLVRGLSEISSMVSAGETSYALLDSGVVRAWGGAGQGALGNDEHLRKPRASPVAVDERTHGGEIREMTGVTAIAAAVGAYSHGIALVGAGQSGNEVMTWGASAFGERGNGEYDNEDEGHAIAPRDVAIAVPALEGKHTIAVAAGGDSDFVLQEEGRSTTLWAWGGNNFGKLGTGVEGGKTCKGDGTAAQSCVPTPQRVDLPALPRGVKVKAISAGRHAAYALLSDGRVLAWGDNAYGQLGDGTTENDDVPRYVCAQGHAGQCPTGPYLEHVKAVSGGELFALALREDGEVVGWGGNAGGSLGSESHQACKNERLTFCQRTPKRVEGLQGVTAISAGSEYGLALVNDGEHQGQVYSWGSNEHGQLGDGKAEGPETCGSATIHHGQNAETFKRQCSRKPLALNGLSDVVGIAAANGADPANGSYAHSFAYLPSGAGPVPLLTVTPAEKKGKPALQLDWSVPSSPESNYKVRWKEVPPADDLNMEKAEELRREAEEDVALANGWEEAAEEAEEAGNQDTVAEDVKDHEEYRTKAEALMEEEKQYEAAADDEYPSSEIVRVAKTCSENSKEWCQTITEAPEGKDEHTPLSNETSYLITLNVNGGEGDYAMRIVGTTP